jgi:hypothetical protein
MNKNDIKVIEDLVPLPFQNELERTFEKNRDLPWVINSTISENPEKYKFKNTNIIEAPGASHVLFWDDAIRSNYFHSIKPIFYYLEDLFKFQIGEILRIRARKTFNFKGHTLEGYTPPHVDLSHVDNYMSLVYYVHETDGDTFFFDKEHKVGDTNTLLDFGNIIKRVSPKKGSAIFFPGRTYHAGNCPVNYPTRTILNFDFTIV